jgi:hypothetical protein
MDVIKFDGGDKRLYDLVAHLVMSEEVLAYNQNYPFKTSSKYLWFVAIENGETLGFVPVKLSKGEAKINNYYVAEDDGTVFSALLKEIVRTLSSDYAVGAVVQTRHIPFFAACGFYIALHWTRYAKMQLLAGAWVQGVHNIPEDIIERIRPV